MERYKKHGLETHEQEAARHKANYWAGKEQAIALEIECWEFQKVEAEHNAHSARLAVEQHVVRLERQKEQIAALKMIEG